jgi:putative acetyltransferase
MALRLEHVITPTDDACTLISELEAELSGRFTAEQRHGLNVQQLFQPHILFFIARHDDDPVGCGGIAFEGGLVELKRMYVRPRARGCGVAQAILARLEEEAQARHVPRIVLETGDVLQAAIRFYQRAGFTRCAAFGNYAAMPLPSIERSVFFQKWIAPPAHG